jgi:hypothetical protein
MTTASLLSPLTGIPDWELRERARREAEACAECRAWRPNHLVGCTQIKVPDPDAELHDCGCVEGTLGCRRVHRRTP